MTRWVLLLGLGIAAHAGATEARVQNRLLVKERHVFLTGGPMLLERADYYVSPGLAGTATWFWSEDDGIELRLGWFFSGVSASAQEVMAHTGFDLDAPAPRGLALVGWRHAFGYGKVMVGPTLIHFDVVGAVHGGALLTRRGPAPAMSLAPGLLVRITPRMFALADVSAFATLEQRQRGAFTLGVLPSLSVGVEL